MVFTSVENNSGLMKKGDYECYLSDCRLTETKNGYPVINFDFVVRADVEQRYRNKHIYKNFYQDAITGDWPNEKIGKYANALGIEQGQNFELDDLIGRSCIVVITHFTTDQGETKDCIFYLKPSRAEPFASSLFATNDYPAMEEDDGELPF